MNILSHSHIKETARRRSLKQVIVVPQVVDPAEFDLASPDLEPHSLFRAPESEIAVHPGYDGEEEPE